MNACEIQILEGVQKTGMYVGKIHAMHCKSSVTLVSPLFWVVHTSERGGSDKQMESSAFQEHAIEASLISFAGGWGGVWESRNASFPSRTLEWF